MTNNKPTDEQLVAAIDELRGVISIFSIGKNETMISNINAAIDGLEELQAYRKESQTEFAARWNDSLYASFEKQMLSAMAASPSCAQLTECSKGLRIDDDSAEHKTPLGEVGMELEEATLTNINQLCPLSENLSQTELATGWNKCRQYAMTHGKIPPMIKGITAECRGWNAYRAATISQQALATVAVAPNGYQIEILKRERDELLAALEYIARFI